MKRKSIDEIISILPPEISMIFFDFDGVFTNNEVIVHEDGTESVICDRSDGLGISLLHEMNIPLMIISTEENRVVSERAKKLGIPVKQGVKNKKATLIEITENRGIDLQNIIYVGNDLNDLECMELAGTSVIPADADPSVRSAAGIILSKPGGKGAVRELAGYILQKKGV